MGLLGICRPIMHLQAFAMTGRSGMVAMTTVIILAEPHDDPGSVLLSVGPTSVLSLERTAQVSYHYLCPGLCPPGHPSPNRLLMAPGAGQREPLPPGGASFPIFTSP